MVSGMSSNGFGNPIEIVSIFCIHLYTYIHILKGVPVPAKVKNYFHMTLVRQSSPNCIFHLWKNGGFCISKISYSISGTTMTGNQFSCFLSECFWLTLQLCSRFIKKQSRFEHSAHSLVHSLIWFLKKSFKGLLSAHL